MCFLYVKTNSKTHPLLKKILKGGTANGNNPAGAVPGGGGGGEGQGEGEGVVRVLGGRGHRHLHQESLGPLDLEYCEFRCPFIVVLSINTFHTSMYIFLKEKTFLEGQ